MAITNFDRVGKALELLRTGLAPFVARELKAAYRDRAYAEAVRMLGDAKKSVADWDVAALLKVIVEAWQDVFRAALGPAERNLVFELRDWRNRWAHQEPFSSDDTYRALDSASRLLRAISAREAADVERLKQELLRSRFEEQARTERRKTAATPVQVAANAGLKPWREVVSPHSDVASGRYQEAEFAADLWQVYLGEGSDEYRKPVEFFRRTHLTASLRRLLVRAVQRLSGQGGDPVVQLQTNFGGGKTHAMIALYHLFSGTPATELEGIESVIKEAGVTALPEARRVVLDGHRLSAGSPTTKPDGAVVHTLWGELAWQLGGLAAYERVRADDERATSPGDTLRQLFNDYGPCVILIDEWVSYARQLHETGDLPGGSFETQFTFAQALTESARAARGCLVVVSLPSSDRGGSPHAQAEDVEVGGLRGREALDRLRNVIGRLESSLRPASAEESFEIVRRRLFHPMIEREQFVARDLAARAFTELYRSQSQEFPPECGEADYEQRIKAAYPVHPEVFERLYSDWSTLLTFQRTRGVLRLMAAVIHALWESGDRSPLIMPSTVPIGEPRVQFELTRNLSENWVPVIDRDVDGPNSLPLQLDNQISSLGRFSACRRVARTVYLGSAPKTGAAQQGVEDRRVKLGCVMPGEAPAVFGDALRRLAGAATYLYQDGPRYWYSTQPTVTKLAEDRAEQLSRDPDKVVGEIERRVRADLRQEGDFSRVHAFPASSQDVPDDRDARLVVLGTATPHSRNGDSPALVEAKRIFEFRGTAPRLYRNALVFLAADKQRLQDLDQAVRRYLAWDSILADKERLNLTPHQVRQAEEQKRSADGTVDAQVPETFQWLLVPVQPDQRGQVEWQALRLSGQDPLAVRASRKLRADELLVTVLAATRLRLDLDRVPLWRGDHVAVEQLVEDFARYVYLPRLKGPSVLLKAVADGVALLTWAEDSFAYADSYDEEAGRYRGLRSAQHILLDEESPAGVLVKPEVAEAQLDREGPAGRGGELGRGDDRTEGEGRPHGGAGEPGRGEGEAEAGEVGKPGEARPRRFHGSVTLDPTRVGRDAGTIAQEVVAHLAALVGARVTVTLDVEADIPDGAPDHVVRTVTENCRTLKFKSHGFERE